MKKVYTKPVSLRAQKWATVLAKMIMGPRVVSNPRFGVGSYVEDLDGSYYKRYDKRGMTLAELLADESHDFFMINPSDFGIVVVDVDAVASDDGTGWVPTDLIPGCLPLSGEMYRTVNGGTHLLYDHKGVPADLTLKSVVSPEGILCDIVYDFDLVPWAPDNWLWMVENRITTKFPRELYECPPGFHGSVPPDMIEEEQNDHRA